LLYIQYTDTSFTFARYLHSLYKPVMLYFTYTVLYLTVKLCSFKDI
jgi:hypothetical protein